MLATGDEIVRAGDPIGPNQIVSSNGPALKAMVAALGGEAIVQGLRKTGLPVGASGSAGWTVPLVQLLPAFKLMCPPSTGALG